MPSSLVSKGSEIPIRGLPYAYFHSSKWPTMLRNTKWPSFGTAILSATTHLYAMTIKMLLIILLIY